MTHSVCADELSNSVTTTLAYALAEWRLELCL